METSQPVSIESFSYSWLVTLESLENSLTTSLDSSDNEATSYIEMDPRLPPSKRFFRSSQDFNFEFHNSQSDDAISTCVHADDLISNGYLMPVFIDPLKNDELYEVSSSCKQNIPTSNSSQYSPRPDLPSSSTKNSDCPCLTRCRRLSKRILEKYFNFLRPLYRRIRSDKTSSKSDKSVEGVKNRVAYSADDYWRRSCDSDSSIFEAVLHCKRSIGKEIK